MSQSPHLNSPPKHGYQGNRGAEPAPPFAPDQLTIALSREAGARGGTIGRRVGRRLGWAVYDHELLEYMAQEESARQEVMEGLTSEAHDWIDTQIEKWRASLSGERSGASAARGILCSAQASPTARKVQQHPLILNLVRLVLALGVRGEAVLIGRGAGCILPRSTTLHVRVVAPREERIAYMSQWLRLTNEEATERVRFRDERRAEYLSTHFQCQVGGVYQYNMVLNSAYLGEDLCADLVIQAARTLMNNLHRGKQLLKPAEQDFTPDGV